MKKGIIIGGVIIIIIGVIILAISNEEIKDTKIVEEIKDTKIVEEIKDTKQKSGPFQINKLEYKLGERIFLRAEGLQSQDKGNIIITRPLDDVYNILYKKIPFDGELKSNFNQMFEPELSARENICDVEDLTGYWYIVFEGTSYSDIKFEVLEEVVLDITKFSEPVC